MSIHFHKHEHDPTWSMVAYNPLSVRQTHRLRDIFDELGRNDVVVLCGTRKPANDLPVRTFAVRDHQVWSWRAANTAYSNMCAGVQIGLRRKRIGAHQVVQVHSPPAALQGRAGALRVKQGDVDFCFIAAYVPPNPDSVKAKFVCRQVWKWISELISSLPHRCMPIVALDANGKTGLCRDDFGVVRPIASPAVGPVGSELENWNGEHLRLLAETQGLCLVNTFFPSGPTYFRDSLSYASRIDYVLMPRCLLERV